MTLSLKEKLKLCIRNSTEVITSDELKTVLSNKKNPKAYIGFELSGMVHLGTGLIAGGKIIDLLEAGCEVVVFLADWHSWINNKLGGNMENIQTAGEYFQSAFEALGITSKKYGKNIKYLWASDLVKSEEYWSKVVKIAKKTTLTRTMRALPIMGRTDNQMEMESAWIFYPPMQAADIFHMDIDIAIGGMDQRKAHVLAREAGEKLGWGKPVALHTPLLSGLKGEGDKMDMDAQSDLQQETQVKMSKSKPDTCIFIHESPEEIKKKLQKAFCPPKVVKGNPVLDICKLIIFPRIGSLEINRPEKYGGNVTFKTYDALSESYHAGELHPSDLKAGVSNSLAEFLSPVREYYKKNPKPLDSIKSLVITR
ncbi:MAG: tyrosine--tRNA ligase [Candidatus Ranarchaeia archaeon]